MRKFETKIDLTQISEEYADSASAGRDDLTIPSSPKSLSHDSIFIKEMRFENTLFFLGYSFLFLVLVIVIILALILFEYIQI